MVLHHSGLESPRQSPLSGDPGTIRMDADARYQECCALRYIASLDGLRASAGWRLV